MVLMHVLMWTTYLLATHPDVQAKLHAEVRAAGMYLALMHARLRQPSTVHARLRQLPGAPGCPTAPLSCTHVSAGGRAACGDRCSRVLTACVATGGQRARGRQADAGEHPRAAVHDARDQRGHAPVPAAAGADSTRARERRHCGCAPADCLPVSLTSLRVRASRLPASILTSLRVRASRLPASVLAAAH